MIPNAGTPRYIPRFNIITERPSPKTSDSEFAFSMIARDESIGVRPSLTGSNNISNMQCNKSDNLNSSDQNMSYVLKYYLNQVSYGRTAKNLKNFKFHKIT